MPKCFTHPRPSARITATVGLLMTFVLFGSPLVLPAQVVTQLGLTSEARQELDRLMTELAASADRSTMGGRMGYAGHSPPDVIKLCRVVRFLAALPAAERYEMLKQWMLPSGPKAEPRTAMCFVPIDSPPEYFFTDIQLPDAAAQAPRDGVICFSELLVDAAAECGKLDELPAIAAAAPENPHMADTISVLTAFARHDEEVVKRQVTQLLGLWQRADESATSERLMPWPAYAVARAWLRSKDYSEQGRQLAEMLVSYAERTGKRDFVSSIHRQLAISQLPQRDCAAAQYDPALALWHPGGYYTTSGIQAGTWPGLWAERDGMIVHHSGPEISPLYFDYPLTGNFDVVVDAYCDEGAEAALQYGRLLFEPCWPRGSARVLTVGQREFVDAAQHTAKPGQFNQLVIQVRTDKVSYLCNGKLAYCDEHPSATTPWLALLARNTRRTAWCNARISGDPVIARRVDLMQGNNMDGWMSPLYREPIPRSLLAAPTSLSPSAMRRYAWYAADGVLHGPAMKTSNPKLAIQSWLAYHRPLQAGDELSYEFYYQPDEAMVYPSLGRTAFILDPAGVHLHWITDIPHMAIAGLAPDNAVTFSKAGDEPAGLSLQPDSWNQVSLRMDADGATLLLNGKSVCRHAIAPHGNWMFGFFRYRNRTAAEVRRITLVGHWPAALTSEQLNNPTARRVPARSKKTRRCQQALVDDTWFSFPREQHP